MTTTFTQKFTFLAMAAATFLPCAAFTLVQAAQMVV